MKMRIKGRILSFDTINQNRDIFLKDCRITIPEKVPLTWLFQQSNVLGFAEITRDDNGLVADAETFQDDIRELFTDGRMGAGGYYRNVKWYKEGNLTVIDEARLCEVALTLAPVNKDYYFEIVEENKEGERKCT